MSHVQIKETSDLSLLQLSSSGDRTAFDAFVTRHQASVFRFASTLSRSSTMAEEILQSTFISAWKGAGGFAGKGDARSWLFSIARNARNRLVRRRVGEPSTLEDIATLGKQAGWGGDNGALLQSLENREWLEKSLRSLSDSDQEVLLLVELEGMTIEEVSGCIGLSKAATKSRLHRARLHLMAALKAEQLHAG